MLGTLARSSPFGKISNKYALSSEGIVNDGYGINSRGYVASHGNGYLLVQLVGESRPYTVLKVKKQISLDGSSESNSKSIGDDPQETSEPETKRRKTSNVQSAKAAKDSRKDESGSSSDTQRGKASLKIRKPIDKTTGNKKNATAGDSPMSSRRNAERERIAKRERNKMKAKEKVLKEQSIKRSK